MATTAELTAYLADLKTARTAILSGNVQSYSIGDMSLTRLDLKYINEEIASVSARLSVRNRGGSVVPKFINGRG